MNLKTGGHTGPSSPQGKCGTLFIYPLQHYVGKAHEKLATFLHLISKKLSFKDKYLRLSIPCSQAGTTMISITRHQWLSGLNHIHRSICTSCVLHRSWGSLNPDQPVSQAEDCVSVVCKFGRQSSLYKTSPLYCCNVSVFFMQTILDTLTGLVSVSRWNQSHSKLPN